MNGKCPTPRAQKTGKSPTLSRGGGTLGNSLDTSIRITNQEALSEDLENDPFLNSALQRFTCELYYRFGSFLAPLSVGIITSRHYLSARNKNGERTSETGDNKNGGDEKTAE